MNSIGCELLSTYSSSCVLAYRYVQGTAPAYQVTADVPARCRRCSTDTTMLQVTSPYLPPSTTWHFRWQELMSITICHQWQEPPTHCCSFSERCLLTNGSHCCVSQTADSLTLQRSPRIFGLSISNREPILNVAPPTNQRQIALKHT